MNYIIAKLLPYSLIFITISGLSITIPLNIPLFIWWSINAIICFLFTQSAFRRSNNQKSRTLIVIYFLWNVATIIRGFFLAENYWDWKSFVGQSFALFIPIFSLVLFDRKMTSSLLRNWLKYSFYIFPIFLLITQNSDSPGRYLSAFYLYMICLFALPKKWKYIVITVAFFSIFYDLGARSNGIRTVVALLIGLTVYSKNRLTKLFKVGQPLCMLAPILLFTLGATDVFNIFQIDKYFSEGISIKKQVNGSVVEENLLGDTRTFLYSEVIKSSIKHHHIIAGRTTARGYDSAYFMDDISLLRNRNSQIGERRACEVSILNIYHYSGLVGVILYFLIFYYASFLAVFRSKNYFVQLIGIFIAFRWCYGWVEDFNIFDINYVTLWFMIAICISKEFRNMNNSAFRNWILTTLPYPKWANIKLKKDGNNTHTQRA